MISRRFTLLGGLAMAGCTTVAPQRETISDDEYDIINMILGSDLYTYPNLPLYLASETLLNDKPDIPYEEDKIVISIDGFPTIYDVRYAALDGEVENEIIDRFFSINKKSLKLDRSRIASRVEKFLSEVEEEEISQQIHDEDSDFRGQLYSFSRFAFNLERTKALGYTSHNCGILCGSGAFVLAERDSEDRWSNLRLFSTWVS